MIVTNLWIRDPDTWAHIMNPALPHSHHDGEHPVCKDADDQTFSVPYCQVFHGEKDGNVPFKEKEKYINKKPSITVILLTYPLPELSKSCNQQRKQEINLPV